MYRTNPQLIFILFISYVSHLIEYIVSIMENSCESNDKQSIKTTYTIYYKRCFNHNIIHTSRIFPSKMNRLSCMVVAALWAFFGQCYAQSEIPPAKQQVSSQNFSIFIAFPGINLISNLFIFPKNVSIQKSAPNPHKNS